VLDSSTDASLSCVIALVDHCAFFLVERDASVAWWQGGRAQKVQINMPHGLGTGQETKVIRFASATGSYRNAKNRRIRVATVSLEFNKK
jgi:hypothetical protein